MSSPSNSKSLAVIGAGAWGTTLAILLAEKEKQINLWAYETDLARKMQAERENKIFLPGFPLSENITITSEAKQIAQAEIILFVVPSQFLRFVARIFKPIIGPNLPIICASKGVEQNSLLLPLQILEEELGPRNYAVLSGPNLSNEIARGLPAASVIAAKDLAQAKLLQANFMLERFRVYASTDPLGVQLGGALKNVVAIAAGIADGLGLGNNAKAALLIRGIAEIGRLGEAMGAQAKTFTGLSGMGDLIATCGSSLSRNHQVGEQIAKGKKLDDILRRMKAVAEGVTTARAAAALGRKFNVEMPVTNEVVEVLFHNKPPFKSISDLMTRLPARE
ncbi:NAD(P)-dependent glycerol-3-phosphate dehydrogenase [Candidatus Saganbacteria bacterium]|nr:NAD(P)-dependent glycerol-3-phosphate dehydrogenase [Candidatus Saganbacteria bacterium]